MSKVKTLGRVESELLRYIDENQPVTARCVADYWLETHGQARTTVLTVIERLKEKGFISRKKYEGVYQYSAKRTSAQILQSLVGDFVSGVLGGSLTPLTASRNHSCGTVVRGLRHGRDEAFPSRMDVAAVLRQMPRAHCGALVLANSLSCSVANVELEQKCACI